MNQARPELPNPASDADIMRLALAAARQSAAQGEVPVGAVLLRRTGSENGTTSPTVLEWLACTHNQPITLHDPSAHAEILALRAGARKLGNYRLDDCELYVTLEPCAMCAQAMLHARIKRVIYGAKEPKTGAAGSVLDLFALRELNHHTEVVGGILAEECAALLRDFFSQRRLQTKKTTIPLREDALRTPERNFEPIWQAWPQLRAHSGWKQDLPELQGLRLHFLDLGPRDSETVWLALHGPDAWWPQWADWSQQLAAQNERVLLPDLIGFGQSDKPKKTGWHSLDFHASVLLAWLQANNIARIHLAYAPGQSMLARRIQELDMQRILALHPVATAQLLTLTEEWRRTPFPDAGHQAGPRAWQDSRLEPGLKHLDAGR